MAACWFVLLSFLHTAMPATPDLQLEALMAFRDSITGDPLGALAGWTSSAHHCSWRGISCDPSNTSVVSIYLSKQQLGGTISPFLGNISTLQYLGLRSNFLHGALPSQLGLCSKLVHVDVNDNHLSGGIPGALGNLKKLQYLDLGWNYFDGTIPSSICSSTSLISMVQEIDLSNNNLSGSVPESLGRCTNLLLLDLSGNMLSGRLPAKIFSQLNLLESLNLSSNTLTGELPLDGGVLKHLTSLDLSLNAFDGAIPKVLEDFESLLYLNLSFNKFQGPVPEGGIFENLDPSSLQGNLGLCGAKIHIPCKSRRHHRFPKEVILIVAFSSSLGLLLLLVSAAIITKRYRTKRCLEDCKRDLETEIVQMHGLKRFTEKDLKFATNSFSKVHMIGKSNLSTVYTGRLIEDGGKRIVVKKLNLHQFPSESNKCFLMELKTLGFLKHRNLVKMVGYAWEPDRLKALVLELMENGSLEDVIHGAVFDRSRWKEVFERLRVCISIANGLVYLHTGYDFPIVHCDLKPSNILFDHDWEAHISDFGVARMLGIHLSYGNNLSTSSLFGGTVGYMAPELAYMTTVTTKVDVFSFGVVIMEFLTRTKPTAVEGKDGHPLSLPEFVADALAGRVHKSLLVLDPDIEFKSSRDVQTARRLLDLAVSCTQAEADARPDMPDVLSSLLKLREEYRPVTTYKCSASNRGGSFL